MCPYGSHYLCESDIIFRMTSTTWDAAAELCARLLDDIDSIAADTTEKIRREFPDYALITREEHSAAVREQLIRRLKAFREQRPWGPSDLEQAIELARRRARQSIPVDILICAYHVGDRELWRRIIADPVDSTAVLPDLTSLMLESMQTISTALVSAHSSEARTQRSIRVTVSQRLLDLLSSNEGGPEAENLAVFLGFEPSGEFLALAWRPTIQHDLSQDLQDIVATLDGVTIHAQFQADCVVLVQGVSNSDLVRATSALGARGLIGVGSKVAGVLGAARSIHQARLALTSATLTQPVKTFSDSWLESCATSNSPIIASEIAHAVEVARSNTAVAATVSRFADSNMSAAQCARDSHMHVNTVTYRLDRWEQLTGWNPRKFSDLSKSVIACIVADGPPK